MCCFYRNKKETNILFCFDFVLESFLFYFFKQKHLLFLKEYGTCEFSSSPARIGKRESPPEFLRQTLGSILKTGPDRSPRLKHIMRRILPFFNKWVWSEVSDSGSPSSWGTARRTRESRIDWAWLVRRKAYPERCLMQLKQQIREESSHLVQHNVHNPHSCRYPGLWGMGAQQEGKGARYDVILATVWNVPSMDPQSFYHACLILNKTFWWRRLQSPFSYFFFTGKSILQICLSNTSKKVQKVQRGRWSLNAVVEEDHVLWTSLLSGLFRPTHRVRRNNGILMHVSTFLDYLYMTLSYKRYFWSWFVDPSIIKEVIW